MMAPQEETLKRNTLGLKLKPIFIGQITIMDSFEFEAYAYIGEEFRKILAPREGITQDFIKNYAVNFGKTLFIRHEDYRSLKDNLKDELTKITRSLSIGDVAKNGNKHANLLTMQLANLYQEPFDDELLTGQYQSTQNLSILLYKNKNIQKKIYHSLSKQGHHYTHIQPLQSSILLLGFLQTLGVFSEQEIHNLFLTSYFKDIGMSFIPREKLDFESLDKMDKILFDEHAENSMKILKSRVPIPSNHLDIIKNHHYLNYKIQARATGNLIESDFLSGVDSALISAIDILVAMTSQRPYRDPMSLFKALELLKIALADEHPQEFRSLVNFLKSFFSR